MVHQSVGLLVRNLALLVNYDEYYRDTVNPNFPAPRRWHKCIQYLTI